MVSLQDVMEALPANDNEPSIRDVLKDLEEMSKELRNGKIKDKDGNDCDILPAHSLYEILSKLTETFDVWVKQLGSAVADKPVNLLDQTLYSKMRNGARRIAESITEGEAFFYN